MNIGEASALSGLPAKTIRYYEDIGLVSPARRGNGYRRYGLDDVHRLNFVQRARGLGFSVEECRSLLSLYHDKKRASADVKALVEQKLKDIEHKISELASLQRTLTRLVHSCQGDARPDCPILDDIAGER